MAKNNRQPKLPVIDPTKNVMSLVAAEAKRQDDLRAAENRRIDDTRLLQKEYERELRIVRAEYEQRLSKAESVRVDALATAESRRIDAVLSSMKADVTLANEKAAATAATLAATVSETRNALDKRLAAVEQNQYQQGGAQSQSSQEQRNRQWVIGVVVAIFLALLALLARMWAGH